MDRFGGGVGGAQVPAEQPPERGFVVTFAVLGLTSVAGVVAQEVVEGVPGGTLLFEQVGRGQAVEQVGGAFGGDVRERGDGPRA